MLTKFIYLNLVFHAYSVLGISFGSTKPPCAQCAANDLIFMLDASEAVLQNTYIEEINFIENILSDSFTESPSWGNEIGLSVHVGIMVYQSKIVSSRTFDELNSYQTVTSYLESIKSIPTGGLSNWCIAMNTSMSWFQQSYDEGRQNVPRTLIILTDGDVDSYTGQCSSSIVITYANSMKNSPQLSVEIIVIATPGSEGNYPASSMPILQQVASYTNVGGVPTPLLYNLTDTNALHEAEQSIMNQMSCCACTPNIVITAEVDEYTNPPPFLQDMFNNIDELACQWLNMTGSNVYLVTYNIPSNSRLAINSSSASTCTSWLNAVNLGCAKAYPFSTSTTCSWEGGYSDLTTGLSLSTSISQSAPHTNPSVGVFFSTGACDVSVSACSTTDVANSITDYNNGFPFRVANQLYVPGVTNAQNMINIAGNGIYVAGTGYNGQTSSNTWPCISCQIKAYLTSIPGCLNKYDFPNPLDPTCSQCPQN